MCDLANVRACPLRFHGFVELVSATLPRLDRHSRDGREVMGSG
jgi:hypothetical protein